MPKQITNLKYYTRNAAPHPAEYRNNAQTPPREALEGNETVLAAYDQHQQLKATARENGAEAIRKREEAKQVRRDYEQRVAEALREGRDPGKLKCNADTLEGQATAHDEVARDARREAAQSGARLGKLVQEHGADYLPGLEQRLADAEARITEAADTLTEAWREWAQAWALRVHLGRVVHAGGRSVSYQPGDIPRDVADLLAQVTATKAGDHLAALKGEETDLAAWREQQHEARETNRRLFGANEPVKA